MSYTEHIHAFGGSPSHPKGPTTIKSPRSNTSRETKLERTRPHVVLLAACLVYLTTALLAFQISILSVSNLKWTEYKRVDDEFRAHSSALHKEKIVYSRLDNLLSTQLKRTFMETHEECLIRGLKEANHELIGLGFQYPDVREHVMEWAMDECGSLQYSPQVVNEKTTPQEAVVTYWASASYRTRRIAEETIGFVRQKLGWVLSHLIGSNQYEEASQTDNAADDEDIHSGEPVIPERPPPPVPFGFALQCQTGKPCRLVYPGDSTMHRNQPRVSPELLDKLREQRKELLAFGSTLDWFRKAVSTVSRIVYYFEAVFHFLCILVYVPVIANSITNKNYSLLDLPNEEMMYLIKSLMLEHICAALLCVLERNPKIFPSMNSALLFAFIVTSIGINMISKPFIPGSQLETVFNIHTSLRDLYSVITDSDTAEEYTPSAPSDGKNKQEVQGKNSNASISSPGDEKVPYASNVCPPSKPHHRLANPETTVEQDIENALQALRLLEQQKANGLIDVCARLESDTESDSDGGDAFVHIAGDVTREASAADNLPAWLMI